MMERDIVSRLARWTGQSVGIEQSHARRHCSSGLRGQAPQDSLLSKSPETGSTRVVVNGCPGNVTEAERADSSWERKRGDLDFQIFTNGGWVSPAGSDDTENASGKDFVFRSTSTTSRCGRRPNHRLMDPELSSAIRGVSPGRPNNTSVSPRLRNRGTSPRISTSVGSLSAMRW